MDIHNNSSIGRGIFVAKSNMKVLLLLMGKFLPSIRFTQADKEARRFVDWRLHYDFFYFFIAMKFVLNKTKHVSRSYLMFIYHSDQKSISSRTMLPKQKF